jgi:hypothetical protein
MAPTVEHLFCKGKVLNSNPSPTKKKKQKVSPVCSLGSGQDSGGGEQELGFVTLSRFALLAIQLRCQVGGWVYESGAQERDLAGEGNAGGHIWREPKTVSVCEIVGSQLLSHPAAGILLWGLCCAL